MMSKRRTSNRLKFICALVWMGGCDVWAGEGIDFESQIRPIFADYCYECHYRKDKGGLRLDTRSSLLQGGESGPAIVPGDAEKSLLIQAVTGVHDDLKMPPKRSLPREVQRRLVDWINGGALWPEVSVDLRTTEADGKIRPVDRAFWSFQPIDDPSPPTVAGDEKPTHPIDAFIKERLDRESLSPVPLASRGTLLRRAYLNLIGLPPAPEELAAFERDSSKDGFGRVVERLLSRPEYGERWGGHWLDLTRYADTQGDAADFPVPEAYRYRNYVIDAFNRDKPYDQFVREQIAGDLLPFENDAQRWEQVIATGYLATSRRVGVTPETLKHIVIEDTIGNLGKTFLGLSIGCARCHDHKFDPIPTEDYYALYGIFQSSIYPHAGAEHQPYRRDFVYRVGRERADEILAPYRDALAPWDIRERAALKLYRSFQFEKVERVGLTRQNTWQDLLRIRAERAEVAARFPDLEIAYAISESKEPKDAHVMAAGSPASSARREIVRRGFLQILGGQTLPPEEQGSGRDYLARWLSSASNPLTARVIANRVWLHHFGKGLVATPSDFGVRGTPPSHPELLDHLASYLMTHDWSLKQLHRYILSSDAYQRSSVDQPGNLAIDPENQWLWRFNRQRLSAEQLRDTILDLSGELDRTPGREHPFPHRLTYFFRQHEPFTEDYESSKRTVYRMRRRLEKDDFLDMFDGPDGNLHLAKRRATTTTLQALYFMNGTFIREQAEAIANRWIDSALPASENLRQLYRQVLGRIPTPVETQRILDSAQVGDEIDWPLVTKALLSSNEFLFID